MKTSQLLVAFLAIATCSFCPASDDAPFPVNVTVDVAKSLGAFRPVHRFFGADEPNYATMKDGRKLLAELGQLTPQQVYFRAHNLLTTGDGTPALKWGSTNAYTEDAAGRPVYDWTILDRIFDTYLARGVRPYAQIGFMPQALSVSTGPYQHEWRPGLDNLVAGWAYPPKDYDKWRDLVTAWVRHCVERYGRAEVEQWYWEVWNEPNIMYWQGTPEEFFKLHDYAIDGVRRALPTARVGGPDVAGSGGKFMDDFLAHIVHGKNYATGETGTPTDFLAFHAKGSPVYVDGHVRMGLAHQLKTIDEGFAKIAAIPELRAKPIIIGESDPEGCAACQSPQNGYRNGTMYSSYTAAAFARKQDLADRHGIDFRGALTWAFEFEDQRYFAGFRALATNGIDLPVLNVFRMLSQMSGQRIATTSDHQVPLDRILNEGVRHGPDVGAFATADGRRIAIMLWHYHDDDLAGPDAAVTVNLAGLPAGFAHANMTEYRIDSRHANAYAEWLRQGSPIAPNDQQYAALQAASVLAPVGAPSALALDHGRATLTVGLSRQAVALCVIEAAP